MLDAASSNDFDLPVTIDVVESKSIEWRAVVEEVSILDDVIATVDHVQRTVVEPIRGDDDVGPAVAIDIADLDVVHTGPREPSKELRSALPLNMARSRIEDVHDPIGVSAVALPRNRHDLLGSVVIDVADGHGLKGTNDVRALKLRRERGHIVNEKEVLARGCPATAPHHLESAVAVGVRDGDAGRAVFWIADLPDLGARCGVESMDFSPLGVAIEDLAAAVSRHVDEK